MEKNKDDPLQGTAMGDHTVERDIMADLSPENSSHDTKANDFLNEVANTAALMDSKPLFNDLLALYNSHSPRREAYLVFTYDPSDWTITTKLTAYRRDGTCDVFDAGVAVAALVYPVRWSSLTFPKFPLLPKELRLKIWGHALPESRLVSVEHYYFYDNEERRPATHTIEIYNQSGNTYEFDKQYMGLLLANTEANYIVSQNYTTLKIKGCNISSLWGEETFELSDLGNTTRPPFIRPKPVDPRRDHLVIEIGVIDGLELCSAWLDLHNFKNIALHTGEKEPLEAARGVREFANRHSHLSKLQVVLSQRHHGFYQNYCFLEVDDNLPSIILHVDEAPRRQYCYNKIMAEKAKADDFNREMAVLAAEPGYTPGPLIAVCLLSDLGPCHLELAATETTYLAPKNPRYYGIAFTTEKPTNRKHQCDGSGCQYSLGLSDFYSSTICRFDGSIITHEDILEDIRYLFPDVVVS